LLLILHKQVTEMLAMLSGFDGAVHTADDAGKKPPAFPHPSFPHSRE